MTVYVIEFKNEDGTWEPDGRAMRADAFVGEMTARAAVDKLNQDDSESEYRVTEYVRKETV